MQKYIGIDARFFSTQATGVGRYTYELIRNLLEIIPDNITLVIYIKEDQANDPLFTKYQDKIILVTHNYDHYSIRSQLHYHKILNSVRLDFLHIPFFNIPPKYKGKYILTIHDLIHHRYPPKKIQKRWKQWFYLYLFKQAVKKAKYLISVSHATENDMLDYYPFLKNTPKSVTLESYPQEFIDNKTDTSKAKEKLDKNNVEAQKYILYVGRHSEHKNIEVLIKAINLLRESDLKLLVGGKIYWETAPLQKLVKKLKLEDKVKFIGFLRDNTYKILLQNAYCYVQPSFFEGFGLPPLEAISQECPVICSDIPCLQEIVGEDNALFFDPHSPEALVKKITHLRNPNLRHNLIQNGLEHLKSFSWHKMAEETLDIYKTLLK